MRVPWRRIKRSPAGRRTSRITLRHTRPQTRPLHQLYKRHSRPSALAPTLFLSFGARCRSDARRHGLFEPRIPRARPLEIEVRRAVGLSRSIVRSKILASSHRRRHSPRCEHHDLCKLAWGLGSGDCRRRAALRICPAHKQRPPKQRKLLAIAMAVPWARRFRCLPAGTVVAYCLPVPKRHAIFYTNKPNKNGMLAIHRPCGCSVFGMFESNERRGVVWKFACSGCSGCSCRTRRLWYLLRNAGASMSREQSSA